MRKTIATNNAPAAIGAYAQAIEVNGFIFTSGQLGMDPISGELEVGVEKQIHQVMKNLKAVLEAADSDLSKIIKTTIYLANMDDFNTVNQVYGEYLGTDFPARSAFQVAYLPKNAAVEIEAIASK